MSAFKTVKLNERQAFAVVRALRGRIDAMHSIHAEAVAMNRADLAGYSLEQVNAAEATLLTMRDAPLWFDAGSEP